MIFWEGTFFEKGSQPSKKLFREDEKSFGKGRKHTALKKGLSTKIP
jgi:hypothetical protein